MDVIAKNSKERVYGLDLLRIFSMVLIVVIHVANRNGINESSLMGLDKIAAANFLDTLTRTAVNCFALLTGYLMIDRPVKYGKISSMIFQVGFYSIGFTVLDKLINPGEVGFRNLLAAVFPASATVWWYYTAYLILFFFIPYINYAINALTKRGFTALLVTVLLLFSVRPTIMLLYGADYIATYGGYTAVWLFALYVIGAYIRKNDIIHKSKTAFVILVYVLSFAITYYVPVILGTVNSLLGIEIPYVCLQEDPSPNILLMSVSMLVLFAKIRIPQCLFKVVEKLSALAFAVYIISEHPFVKKYIAAGNFEFIAEHPAILIPIECIVWSGAIYLLCCLLELLRLRLFRLVKMERAEACLTAVFEKVRPYAEHE